MKKQTSYFRTLTKILLFSGSLSMVPISPLFAKVAVYSAYQQKITGTIKDAKGEILSGATVSVKGTQNRTQTDVNGNFELSEVPNGATLTITMIGYLNKEVPVTGSTVSITLEEDPQGLDEVVVVGYGSLDKKELTSAVTTIKPKDFVPGTVSPILAMQGKVAGLNVSSNNGTDPNAGVSLQLRGVNSVNASQGPLVVIDGVPGGDVNSVAKEDIESINVLRDASAAAIYGTRASGGVILITTKRPQIGKPSVNFTSEYFMETVRKRPQVLSAEKFVEVGLGDDLGYRTDWYDEVTNKNPFSHRQVINVSGGSEDANVYATFVKRDAKGIALGSKRGEIGGRINTNFRFFDGFAELSTNASYNQVDADFTNNDIFNMAMVLNPTETPYNADDITGYNVLTGGYDYWNPVAEVMLRDDRRQYRYLLANSTLKLNLTEHLSTSATVGIKSNSEHGSFYRSAQHRLSRQDGIDGYASQDMRRNLDRVFEWTVNYNKRWEDHSVNAVGGYSYQDFNGQGFSGNNSDFPVDGIKENDMGTGSFLPDGRSGLGSWKNPWVKLAAFFGRVNYSYLDRYIVTATARYEGSSKFAPENRWGFFPGVSVGWRMSQEPFMKDVTFINDLKFRAGYGETGNEGFGAEVSTRMYSADTWFLQNGQWFRTYGVRHNQNPGIKWEVKKEYNVGMDFTILNNKLGGRVDFYKRVIDDLIYDISVSQPPAIHDKTTMNVGSMQNTGYEFELNYKAVQQDNFSYTTSIVASHNKSKLNSLWGSQTFSDRKGFPAPGSPGSAVRLYPGEEIGRFFLWQFAGFTDDGYWQLYDKDGNIFDVRDKNKTVGDKKFVGQAIPTLQLSWNNEFTYKNWDANIYMRSWIGHDVFNMINMYYSLPNVKGQNVLDEAYEDHKNIVGEKELSDYWLEKGSFLKVDAINIGYTFNREMIKPFKSLRVYATGRDLFVFTKYSGLDPEVNINGLEPGFEERNVYPKTRTFMFGLQLNF
ncbi:SusC/RagA family TonB-linked outer membrane protein [Sphingobacterium endophyticum]|uniref:SusC/RagA family TonB-linked outer membrane protein n=1 Tax=Sphingobacterium endophyticum TaxID=2546448 RepID=UPI0012E2B3E2|nr:SusC/RagA family TonB-linked outer membrane protein [Sphingobacterium endophyticum]